MPTKQAAKPTERPTWKREAEVHDLTTKLGVRLRDLRSSSGMSLTTASERTGISVATLSRIENNKMAPTFGLVIKLVEGLGLSWSDVLALPDESAPPAVSEEARGKISVYRPGEAVGVAIRMNGIDYQSLHSELADRSSLSPRLMSFNHRSLEEAGGLMGHPGVEFCFVLEGVLDLHFESKPTQRLPVGASALFDADIPHAYVSAGEGPVRLLCVLDLPSASAGEGALLRRLGMNV